MLKQKHLSLFFPLLVLSLLVSSVWAETVALPLPKELAEAQKLLAAFWGMMAGIN